MARFLKPVDDLGYIDGIKWRVKSDIEFESDVLRCTVTVKAGRITDFASIPRPLWSVYPPARYAGPASVHDELYATQTVTRKKADQTFLEALKCDGVPYLRRYAFYWSLRSGGWVAWRKHAERLKKESELRTTSLNA